jgi:glycosyltransferase involved in cell wall biosynthesis
VICPGKKAQTYWESINTKKRKIKIVHFYTSTLPLDSAIIKFASELRSKFKQKIIILFFGRLIKKKGADYLIQAFAMLQKEFRDIALIIVGEGPEKYNLEKLCRELDLQNVLLVGAIDEKIKPSYFLAADIYVYPSVTLELPEEWPLGVVEAMSVGKPVILTTAVGSAPDVVKQGINGFTVAEKDGAALYRVIKIVIENPDLRKKMGIASEEIVKNSFTCELAVEALDTAIKTVINSKVKRKTFQENR